MSMARIPGVTPSFLKSSTNFFTASQDLSKAAFSSGVSGVGSLAR